MRAHSHSTLLSIARVSIVLGLLATLPIPASAQFGQSLGELYLSFDPLNRVATADYPTFTQFDFYLLVDMDWADVGLAPHNFVNGIRAWEASVAFRPELLVLGEELIPATSINVVQGAGNYVVGVGRSVLTAQMPSALVHFVGFLSTEGLTDLVLSIGGAPTSSFPSGAPGWLESRPSAECSDPHPRCLREFTDWSARLVINCRLENECNSVANRNESFGAVKARFAP